jgi:hypothetical protein
MPQCNASAAIQSQSWPVQRPNIITGGREMHDRKLLSDNDLDAAALAGRAQPAGQPAKHVTTRASFWAVIGFCTVGLICSLYVPSSYLHLEQTSVLLAQTPLS